MDRKGGEWGDVPVKLRRIRCASKRLLVAPMLTLLLAALAIAGCGGGSGNTAGSNDPRTNFSEHCAGCHTLTAAGAKAKAGPNLDATTMSSAAIALQIKNGGGGMPAFGRKLSAEQIAKLAHFVGRHAGASGSSAAPGP